MAHCEWITVDTAREYQTNYLLDLGIRWVTDNRNPIIVSAWMILADMVVIVHVEPHPQPTQ